MNPRIYSTDVRTFIFKDMGMSFFLCLGLFGSVIYISGNSAKHHTQVVS